jgi:penicillin amidase
MLKAYDGHSTVGSAAALLFELWLSSHLRPAILNAVAPDPALRNLLAPAVMVTLVRLMEGQHTGLARRAGLETTKAREALLCETLSAAWADACARFGTDTTKWRWGDLHKGWFDHALTPVHPGYDVGPLDKGGNSACLMLAHYEASDYRVRTGASVRMVVDVGAWDNSVWINAPGQSGVPNDPHYADLAEIWARGEYVPMLYSAEAVDAVTTERIELRPKA